MHYKKIAADPLYFLLNKPAGYVCSSVSDRSPTVLELFPEEFHVSPEGAKLHTVGRLDKDTTGLLLVTNDGKFSNYLTRPESNISKTYEVTLRDPVSFEQQQEYTEKAAEGVLMPPDKKAGEQISGPAVIQFTVHSSQCTVGEPKNAVVEPKNPVVEPVETTCTITLSEGKFHEVKRIFQTLGNEVVGLKRIAIGSLELPPDLEPGNWIKLTTIPFQIQHSSRQ